MQHRPFGKTGLMLPAITCGCMRFQQSWNAAEAISSESQKNVEACVHRALELGINHFETARGYGTSEGQLGRILPKLPRERIVVQTKVGPESDVSKFAANFDDSMRRLGLDYVDIFSIHGINNDALLEDAMRCLDAAMKWKEQGRVRHIGFASHGTADILLKTIRTGAFESVNLHWFYIYQDNWPAVAEAAERGMGVYIISPNDKGGMLYRPSEKFRRLTAPLHPMAFNDLFCLAHAEVTSIGCGVAKPSNFDVHIEAAARLGQAAETIAPIVARIEDEMVRVLGKDWVDTWRTGLPDWKETPGEINVRVILLLRNLALAFDMHEYAKMRYNLLGNGDHWFPGNKAGAVDARAMAECLKHSPHADRIPALLEETHRLLAGDEVHRLQRDA